MKLDLARAEPFVELVAGDEQLVLPHWTSQSLHLSETETAGLAAGTPERAKSRAVTPAIRAVYDELLERATTGEWRDRAVDMREHFYDRSGRFELDHPAREARERAAWDWVIVRGGAAEALADDLNDPAERALAQCLGRAQRGLFLFHGAGRTVIARDLWGGAEFLLASDDDLARALSEQKRTDPAPCDVYVAATAEGATVLPGHLFHPAEARPLIEATLEAGRDRSLAMSHVLDSLLRMEHALRTLSRVSVRYAYRPGSQFS
jgi:hypothetical protein